MRPRAALRMPPSGAMRSRRTLLSAIWTIGVAVWVLKTNQGSHAFSGIQLAYIGPGAGFVFLGSFLSLLSAFLLSALSFLTWPLRMLWRTLCRRQGFKKARIRKLIFLGLDGLDPNLVERFMAEGRLPNLTRLRDQGTFTRLRTTFPSLSPVAWSTFATGVSPAKHNIFDFLNRNLKSYMPELSSSKVNPPRKIWKLGRYRIPLSSAFVEMRRKSKPFWKILGEQHIDCTILRVPVTFPPDKFNGRLLSAMCTPDLLGTQGSFSLFTTRVEKATYESGAWYPLERNGNRLRGFIRGPENSLVDGDSPLKVGFDLAVGEDGAATLEVDGQSYRLQRGEYSPWVNLSCRAGLGIQVRGICRFLLTELGPEVSLYVSPINMDPEEPALPISHPSYYATYLAKLLGCFSTLGMAEDTWALNEGVIDEESFLKQAYSIHGEREAMFFSALERTERGVVTCVFDASDRVQHMFYRYLDPRSGGPQDDAQNGKYRHAIEDLYSRMDTLVGRTFEYMDEESVLFVLSDHGFCSFRRGVNLNSWLNRNGYLALQDAFTEGGAYLQGIDWSRTKAYTFGLAGLYINQKGREAQGIVAPGPETDALKRELTERLSGLRDEEWNQVAINRVYVTDSLYKGPYLDAAPDLIVGYNEGYRSSWDAALGKTTGRVIEDNLKAWSGDHCIDPLLVPGVLFSNRKIDIENPGIEDLAPTALALFGVKVPGHMDGKPIFRFAECAGTT